MTPNDVIIPDRGEFINALQHLRRGKVLVQSRGAEDRCVLDGSLLYSSYKPLAAYKLIDEFDNPLGFAQMRYYRLSPSGREFAERACQAWRQRPLLERLAVRLTG